LGNLLIKKKWKYTEYKHSDLDNKWSYFGHLDTSYFYINLNAILIIIILGSYMLNKLINKISTDNTCLYKCFSKVYFIIIWIKFKAKYRNFPISPNTLNNFYSYKIDTFE